MIPHQFHWVWPGHRTVPEKHQAWMRSWREKHPTWNCTLWAEHPENLEIERFEREGFEVRPLPPLINQKFYDEIGKWVAGPSAAAARSDIVRYEIVLRGGICLDTDVECFGNIEHLLCGVSLCVADEWGAHPGNYLLGAAPNHPAIYSVVRGLGPHLSALASGVSAVEATGAAYLYRQLRRHPDLVIYPHMLFNPLRAFDSPEKVTQWPAVSLANHHCEGKWYDRLKNEPPLEFL